MPQEPTARGGQNQTLLELIYSLKGLAQTVEFLHQDLSRKLDEESKARVRELDRLRDIIAKNNQALSVLPITLSDRVEKLMAKTEENLGVKFKTLDDAISEVRDRLWEYTKSAERAISQHDAVEAADERADVTGKIEVDDKGRVKVMFNSEILKKLWYAILFLAAAGGVVGIKEVIEAILKG